MRAGSTSANEQPRRTEHSRSEYRSSTDITNTKRSKDERPCTHLSKTSWPRFRLMSFSGKWGEDGSDGAGDINLIAVLITLRLHHPTAASLKTGRSPRQQAQHRRSPGGPGHRERQNQAQVARSRKLLNLNGLSGRDPIFAVATGRDPLVSCCSSHRWNATEEGFNGVEALKRFW